MADSVTTQSATLATVPASTKIATDEDATNGHVQIIKLAISTDGSATVIPATTADGLLVNLGTNNDVVISDGGGSITVDGSLTTTSAVKSRIKVNSAGLTTATTAYSANDQAGTILEFTSAVATSGGMGVLNNATLLDKAKIVGAMSLYLFDRSVTLAADNAAADFSDADMDNCVAIVEFPPPTVANAAASNGFSQSDILSWFTKCNATSLFGALVTRSGHTFFGAVTDLVPSLFLETS